MSREPRIHRMALGGRMPRSRPQELVPHLLMVWVMEVCRCSADLRAGSCGRDSTRLLSAGMLTLRRNACRRAACQGSTWSHSSATEHGSNSTCTAAAPATHPPGCCLPKSHSPRLLHKVKRSAVGGICLLSGSGSVLKACESCGWVWSCCLVQPKQAGKGFVHSLTAWAHSHVLAKCHPPNMTQLTRLFSAYTAASPGLLWITFLSAQQRHHLPFLQGRLSRLASEALIDPLVRHCLCLKTTSAFLAQKAHDFHLH